MLNNLIKNQYSPLLASIHWEPQNDTEEEQVKWLQQFVKLPLEVRLGLGSLKAGELVRRLADKYQIRDYREIGELARIIRDVFVEEIGRPKVLKRLGRISSLKAEQYNNFLKDLGGVVKLIYQEGLHQARVATEEIPIILALKKYPNVGEMLITDKPLRLEVFSHPVRPSVKNWLEDYFEKIGTSKHNSLERGHYLFNSENAKLLSWQERRRLEEVLRSFDNETSLLIDTENQQIIFRGPRWSGFFMEDVGDINNADEKKNDKKKLEEKKKEQKPFHEDQIVNRSLKASSLAVSGEKKEQKEKNVIDLREY